MRWEFIISPWILDRRILQQVNIDDRVGKINGPHRLKVMILCNQHISKVEKKPRLFGENEFFIFSNRWKPLKADLKRNNIVREVLLQHNANNTSTKSFHSTLRIHIINHKESSINNYTYVNVVYIEQKWMSISNHYMSSLKSNSVKS